MFLGHIAVGFAAKRAAPRASLGALMTAPVLLDLLWPLGLILGIEKVRIAPGDTAFTPLDFTHRPDLQLVPWSPVRVGLGLWNSVPATVRAPAA